MKKNFVIDSQVESDLIEVFDTEKSEEEVLDEYLAQIKKDKRFTMVKEIEKYDCIAIVEVDGIYGIARAKIKVVEVPVKFDIDEN